MPNKEQNSTKYEYKLLIIFHLYVVLRNSHKFKRRFVL